MYILQRGINDMGPQMVNYPPDDDPDEIMEQITEVSREIEGLKLENEVFRNYLERQVHDQPEGEEMPSEGKKARIL